MNKTKITSQKEYSIKTFRSEVKNKEFFNKKRNLNNFLILALYLFLVLII